MSFSIAWAKVDLNLYPQLVTAEIPGPISRATHARASAIMKGYSSQVKLFPVVFDKGYGCTLTDVDGNTYLDFSSGIPPPENQIWTRGFMPESPSGNRNGSRPFPDCSGTGLYFQNSGRGRIHQNLSQIQPDSVLCRFSIACFFTDHNLFQTFQGKKEQQINISSPTEL